VKHWHELAKVRQNNTEKYGRGWTTRTLLALRPSTLVLPLVATRSAILIAIVMVAWAVSVCWCEAGGGRWQWEWQWKVEGSETV
jgi:uncharacterized membrane protein